MKAKEFKQIREKELGLSVIQFAQYFGFSRTQVYNIENSEVEITKKNERLMQMASLLAKKNLIKFKNE